MPGTCFLALSAHIPTFAAAYERADSWGGRPLPEGFTPAERARCEGRAGWAQGLAARWAAKEAAARLSGRPWWSFEVLSDPSGAPRLVCREGGARGLSAGRLLVTLTHEGEVATAWVALRDERVIAELDQ